MSAHLLRHVQCASCAARDRPRAQARSHSGHIRFPKTSCQLFKSRTGTQRVSPARPCSTSKHWSINSSRHFETLIFDLDGVLYPTDNGYMAHVRANATRFITEKYKLEWDEAEAVRAEAFAKANQTVAVLRMLGYEVDAAEFADFCRAGEDEYLIPIDDVITALTSLSARYGGKALGVVNHMNH